MQKLTVNKSYTAYQGKTFEGLSDYLEYQAEMQSVCTHETLLHIPSENNTHVYDNSYCEHCGALVINNIIAK